MIGKINTRTKVSAIKWDTPYHKCFSCGKETSITFVFWQDHDARIAFTNNSLCPSCVATLHALTSPLSVLVQTGENIEKDSQEKT